MEEEEEEEEEERAGTRLGGARSGAGSRQQVVGRQEAGWRREGPARRPASVQARQARQTGSMAPRRA